MRVLIILGLALGAVVAAPPQSRIVGGNPTFISEYPEMVALLFSSGTTNFRQACAGVILNNRSVLTVAHCVYGDLAARWRFRAGSTLSNSGGTIFTSSLLIVHNQFNIRTLDNDIAIVRSGTNIPTTALIQPAALSNSATIGDTQPVLIAGWGAIEDGGAFSNELRHTQVWTVNQDVCTTRYRELRMTITNNMLCTGVIDIGGRDQCQGDAGSPVFHTANKLVVGISSFGYGCGNGLYPGVNTRVFPFINWIMINA